MTHRLCLAHLAEGKKVTGRGDPLYDPLTGQRIPVDLCGDHRDVFAKMVTGYRALLAELTPDVDQDLICRAKRDDGGECGYPAKTRQGLSRHETAEHPDPNGQRCPICQELTTNLKTHTWREHPDGDDAEAVDQLAARTRVYETCGIGGCEAGPFLGAIAYTSHLSGRHPDEAPRCPVGHRAPPAPHLWNGDRYDCDVITLMPDRHIRHRHGIVAFREWVAVGRPGQRKLPVYS